MKGYFKKDIKPFILLRIYKMLRDKPLKTFVISDFGGSDYEKYLHILYRLGIVDKVTCIYLVGRTRFNRKETVGYRLVPSRRPLA